jgi:hypothetical protein
MAVIPTGSGFLSPPQATLSCQKKVKRVRLPGKKWGRRVNGSVGGEKRKLCFMYHDSTCGMEAGKMIAT